MDVSAAPEACSVLERVPRDAVTVVGRAPSAFARGTSNERSSIMQIDGACHCGLISFTAQIDPLRVMVCHCTDCQVLSGAPFRAAVAAATETFVLRGQPKCYIKVAQSGNRRAQFFCPECGTPLYASAPENPPFVLIRLGCVTQRAQLKPVVQLWQHSALPWLAELPSIPGSPEQQGFLPPGGVRQNVQ
jgi:hypothetical protein